MKGIIYGLLYVCSFQEKPRRTIYDLRQDSWLLDPEKNRYLQYDKHFHYKGRDSIEVFLKQGDDENIWSLGRGITGDGETGILRNFMTYFSASNIIILNTGHVIAGRKGKCGRGKQFLYGFSW